MKVFEKEAKAGFPRLSGTWVRATIPIAQELVDRLSGDLPLDVTIHEGNRISISYGVVRAAAEIVQVTPEMTVILSTSWLSRTALSGALAWKPELQAYLRKQGKFVHVVCSRIPAVARYQYLWRHVSEVQARTAPGRLVLDIQVFIR
jgi:hypothetical protein